MDDPVEQKRGKKILNLIMGSTSWRYSGSKMKEFLKFGFHVYNYPKKIYIF